MDKRRSDCPVVAGGGAPWASHRHGVHFLEADPREERVLRAPGMYSKGLLLGDPSATPADQEPAWTCRAGRFPPSRRPTDTGEEGWRGVAKPKLGTLVICVFSKT